VTRAASLAVLLAGCELGGEPQPYCVPRAANGAPETLEIGGWADNPETFVAWGDRSPAMLGTGSLHVSALARGDSLPGCLATQVTVFDAFGDELGRRSTPCDVRYGDAALCENHVELSRLPATGTLVRVHAAVGARQVERVLIAE
jgi:hypothetical protein